MSDHGSKGPALLAGKPCSPITAITCSPLTPLHLITLTPSTMSSPNVIIVFGLGKRVSTSVVDKFRSLGWKIVTVARSAHPEFDGDESVVHVQGVSDGIVATALEFEAAALDAD